MSIRSTVENGGASGPRLSEKVVVVGATRCSAGNRDSHDRVATAWVAEASTKTRAYRGEGMALGGRRREEGLTRPSAQKTPPFSTKLPTTSSSAPSRY